MSNFSASIFLFLFCFTANAQYAPPAGQPGSTAIWKDSSAFTGWAKACVVTRGYQNIADTALGLAYVGNDTMATGKPGEKGMVSLGDGGFAVCTFEHPIRNGAGFDFAVFENSFDGLFLELAVVEVSSNGIDFVRFPAHSLTDTTAQKGTFDLLDATQLNNLAGKYRAGFGTPFDLDELAGNSLLDLENVTHVKLIDVVGSLDDKFATLDAFGNKINDPFPTPFENSGFDLDAIGVIHQNNPMSVLAMSSSSFVRVYPNPVNRLSVVHIESENFELAKLTDVSGKEIVKSTSERILLADFPAGVYFLHINSLGEQFVRKLIVQ